MKAKTRLVFSFVLALVTTATCIGMAAAWWVPSMDNLAFFIIRTNDARNLKVDMYVAKDYDRDGILDEWVDVDEEGIATQIDPSEKTMEDICENMYDQFSVEGGNVVEDIFPGSVVSYKMVIKNIPPANNFPVMLSMYLSKLTSDARILFRLQNIKINAYKNTEYTTEPSSYFDDANKGSLDSNEAGKAWYSCTVDELFYLWNISNNEDILSDIFLKNDYVMEVDFCLYCLSVPELNEFYYSYALKDFLVALDELWEIWEPMNDEYYRNTYYGNILGQVEESIDQIYGSSSVEAASGHITAFLSNINSIFDEIRMLNDYWFLDPPLSEEEIEIIDRMQSLLTQSAIEQQIENMVAIREAYDNIYTVFLSETYIEFPIDSLYINGKFITDN